MATADTKVENVEEKPADNNQPNQWDDDFDKESLTIPYKREDETVEEPEENEEEKPQEDEIVETPVEEKLEDPGDYKPADYSFEIKVGDKTVKIDSPEQAEKIAEENAEELDAKALLKLVKESNKMALSLERDEKDHKEKVSEYQSKLDERNEQTERVQNTVNELNYLVSRGDLPKISEADKKADWSDKEVQERPGIKEQRDLLAFMQKENGIREKAGLKPLTSVLDAFSAWKLEESKKLQVETKKAAGEARKNAGAKVSAASNNPSSAPAPKGIAVGRVGAFQTNQSQWE